MPDGSHNRKPSDLHIHLQRRMMAAAMNGEIDECLLIQTQLESESAISGTPMTSFSREYFEHLHKSMQSAMSGDIENAERLSARAMEIARTDAEKQGFKSEDFGEPDEQLTIPPEYDEIQKKIAAAMEAGDTALAMELIKSADAVLAEIGIINIVNVIREGTL